MIEARLRIERGAFTLDAEFSVPAGGVTAIFGPSGSGKTLLLRTIAGLEGNSTGSFKIGDDVWQSESSFLAPHKRSVGYVFQEPSLFPHLSVRRNLEYAVKRVPDGSQKVTFEEAVALLGVEPLLCRNPDSLSGGERQRAAIARALLTSPRLLLMDEPLASLDIAGKSEILPFLDRLHRELQTPILYVSHSPDEVAQLADYLVLLEHGSVLATGPIGEMLTRLDLPPAHGPEAEAVIEAEVAGYDAEDGLTYVDFAGGRITVVSQEMPLGRLVRIRLRARDVSLTLERHANTSILNILEATVEELSDNGHPQVTVRLSVGGLPILSRITRRSAITLDLVPGRKVFAQIKSVALLA